MKENAKDVAKAFASVCLKAWMMLACVCNGDQEEGGDDVFVCVYCVCTRQKERQHG